MARRKKSTARRTRKGTKRSSLGALSPEGRAKALRTHLKHAAAMYEKAKRGALSDNELADCSEVLRAYGNGMANEVLAERKVFAKGHEATRAEMNAYFKIEQQRFDTENAISRGCITKKRQFEIA